MSWAHSFLSEFFCRWPVSPQQIMWSAYTEVHFSLRVFVYNSGKCWVWAAGRIRMVMAHCSQHRCKGDDEMIPLCTSASVLATAALPLIWIEASQSEYGWRWPLIGCQWLCSASHWLIGSMCSFVKASIRNIGEMEDWANEGNQNQNWDRFHLL
mgnify:CR=1 FL=1